VKNEGSLWKEEERGVTEHDEGERVRGQMVQEEKGTKI
jgi:hypothetical protein